MKRVTFPGDHRPATSLLHVINVGIAARTIARRRLRTVGTMWIGHAATAAAAAPAYKPKHLAQTGSWADAR